MQSSNTSSAPAQTSSSSKGRTSGSKFKSLLSKLHRGQASSSSSSSSHTSTSNRATSSPPATTTAAASAGSSNMAGKAAPKQSQKQQQQQSSQPDSAVANGQLLGAASASASTSNGLDGSNDSSLQKAPSPAQQIRQQAIKRDMQQPVQPASLSSQSVRAPAGDNADQPATNDQDEYLQPGEEDGADANASMRPHTPSTIDAASSFTGSRRNSNGSLAPTSRTFKSFVTGHSKASASTKPVEGRVLPPTGNMREESANRIATRLHEPEPGPGPGPFASSTSPTDAVSSDGAALPASLVASTSSTSGSGSLPKPSPLRNSIEGGAIIAEHDETPPLSATADGPHHPSRPALASSNSITFSALPPSSPSLAQTSAATSSLPQHPSSPLVPSNASIRSLSNSLSGPSGSSSGMVQYPRHSHHDPKNNPRPSSPPPDNASILTLASSTAPSVHGSSSIRPTGPGSIAESRINHKSSLGAFANEDASIRAIPPSRRESGDSFGSKWSAALLSTRETNRDGKESYYTASVMNGEQ